MKMGTQRKRRSFTDARPEEYPYRDDGCEISASCLTCPLPQCKYDNPRWFRSEIYKRRYRLVLMALYEDGLSVKEAASRFQVSQRTIFRIRRVVKYGELEPAPEGVPHGPGAFAVLS
jgi:hypothetical protein